MKRSVLGVLIAVVLVAGGVGVWWFTSTDIDNPVEVTAPPLAADTTGAETTTGDTDTTAATEAVGPTAGSGVFELVEGTTVTFELDEELRGQPKRVVATNTEVAGQLAFDPSDLTGTELGTIVIGAQTFATDSSNRDRAIRGPILDSDSFPTIQFVPTAVDGLPASAAVGDELSFTVVGDLTIRETTTPVTFDVTATLTAEDRLEGTAETTVLRRDYGLEIPSVPSVANVSDEVLLRIDFVAAPAS
jgi:polyisoprenoid-binding protein YceI